MMAQNIKSALIAAVAFALMALPLLGVNLKMQGLSLNVELETANAYWFIAAGVAAVFFVQLARSYIRLPTMSSMPTFSSLVAPRQQALVRNLLMCFVLAAMIAFPFFADRPDIDLSIKILIYVMLGLGLNIVVGIAGLLDLGFVGFYAVGAYTYAMLNSYFGLGFWSALPIAGLFAAFFGFALGFPVLRLRGDYLAIVTLGFGEIIRILLNNFSGLTGGPAGISGIDKPTFFGLEFNRSVRDGGFDTFHNYFGLQYEGVYRLIFIYFVALILVIILLYVINRLIRMPIGRAWEALREDEIAARSLGLNPTLIKLSAFTIGASTAGLAGALFAAYQNAIEPLSFVFIESVIILAVVVLGGMGSLTGVVLAAIALIFMQDYFTEYNEYRMLFFGIALVLMMIWRPQGLVPMKRPKIYLHGGRGNEE